MDDCNFEETEYFNVTLHSDDRSAILKPSESTAIVFILDNEGKKNSSILFSGLFFVVVKLHWLVLKDQVM